jgi:hypothetical protein
MKYEVHEYSGQWVVLREGAEVARFAEQDEALGYVAARLRDREDEPGSYSLTMRYQARS